MGMEVGQDFVLNSVKLNSFVIVSLFLLSRTQQ